MCPAEPDKPTSELPDNQPLISHDLRSALVDVLGGLQMIDMDGVSPENHRHVQRALASGLTLWRLVERLSVELPAGQVGVLSERGDFALESFLTAQQHRWRQRAEDKGLLFHVDWGAGLPEYVQMDRTALDRVMSNLIENAIKFSEKGSVSVSVGLEDDEALTILVRDAGDGFDQDAMQNLFEYKARPKHAKFAGSGMGLHIVKQLVVQMGGEVSVFNAAAGGVVVLSFPKSTWQSLNVEPRPTQPAFGLQGQRILLAEDNETSQLLLHGMLTGLGAELFLARDGVKALQVFEQQNIDLVLLDLEMPRLSGQQVLRRIRNRNDAKAKVPIITISAFVVPDDEASKLMSGATGMIPKPITDVNQLAAQIYRILGWHPDVSPNLQKDNRTTHSKPLDQVTFDNLQTAVGRSDLPKLLSKVLDDLLSVQYRLSDALQRQDFNEVRAQTHVLISVAGAVGAQDLQIEAQALNHAAHGQSPEASLNSAWPCLSGLRTVIAVIKARLQDLQEATP